MTSPYQCTGSINGKRCQEESVTGYITRGKVIHLFCEHCYKLITQAEWLKELFEYDYCPECHGDVEDHDAIPFLGNWFARCKENAKTQACPEQSRRENKEVKETTDQIQVIKKAAQRDRAYWKRLLKNKTEVKEMTLTCRKCGYQWESRVPRPKKCPECTTRRWEKE